MTMDPAMLHLGYTAGTVSAASYLRDILDRLIYDIDPADRMSAVELGLALNRRLPGFIDRDTPADLARFIGRIDPDRRMNRQELAAEIVDHFDIDEEA